MGFLGVFAFAALAGVVCSSLATSAIVAWEDAGGSWPILLGLVATTVVILALCLWLASKRRRSWWERFVAGREPLSDAEFVKALRCSPEEASACVAVRQATGKMLDLPPEFIQPGDEIDELWLAVFDNPEETELHHQIEQALHADIPIDWWLEHVDKRKLMWMHNTFGDFALRLGRELRDLSTTNNKQPTTDDPQLTTDH